MPICKLNYIKDVISGGQRLLGLDIGKKTIGLVRSAFIFNSEGTLTHAQRNLRAKGYAERVLSLLAPK